MFSHRVQKFYMPASYLILMPVIQPYWSNKNIFEMVMKAQSISHVYTAP